MATNIRLHLKDGFLLQRKSYSRAGVLYRVNITGKAATLIIDSMYSITTVKDIYFSPLEGVIIVDIYIKNLKRFAVSLWI
jgi:hypothetical protein